MKVVCKYTHSIFIFGSSYDAKVVPSAPLYKNGEWYSRFQYEIVVGKHSHKGEPRHFYTIEEWRELQLNKVIKEW